VVSGRHALAVVVSVAVWQWSVAGTVAVAVAGTMAAWQCGSGRHSDSVAGWSVAVTVTGWQWQ
jgi:hypothetical protein